MEIPIKIPAVMNYYDKNDEANVTVIVKLVETLLNEERYSKKILKIIKEATDEVKINLLKKPDPRIKF
jgi:hypothetical protein